MAARDGKVAPRGKSAVAEARLRWGGCVIRKGVLRPGSGLANLSVGARMAKSEIGKRCLGVTVSFPPFGHCLWQKCSLGPTGRHSLGGEIDVTGESSHREAEPSVELKDPMIAALLAWLIPGMGHFYQGRFAKAILFFVCISETRKTTVLTS